MLATYASNANYTTAFGVDEFSVGKATPAVSVADPGGTYNSTSVFPATAATVTGVGSDGTIASFGSSSLSYAYYSGSYATVAALDAANPPALAGPPSNAGSYTVLATYVGSASYATASGLDEFSIGKATPAVSVTDPGGTYNATSVFAATAATVTGVGSDGTIASFGSSSLSYAYYSGSYATVAALNAANPPALAGPPSSAGSYTVLATYAGSRKLRDGQWSGRFLDWQGHADGERGGRGRDVQHVGLPGDGGHGHRCGQRRHNRQLRQQQFVVCLLLGNVQHRSRPHRGQSAGLGRCTVSRWRLHCAGHLCRRHELRDSQRSGRFLDWQGHAGGERDGRGRHLQRHVRLPGDGGHGHRRGQRRHNRQLRQQQFVVCLLLGNLRHGGGPHRGQSAGLGRAPSSTGSYTVLATYAGSTNYTTASGVDDFSIGKATPTVSVTDAGGAYNGTSAFPATAATVTGVGSDGTIASFGSSSLSYAYYAGTYSTVAALTAANPPALVGAPVGAGSYTVLATYAAARVTQRPAEWTISRSARPRPR